MIIPGTVLYYSRDNTALLATEIVIILAAVVWWIYAIIEFEYAKKWYRVLVLLVGICIGPVVGILVGYMLRNGTDE